MLKYLRFEESSRSQKNWRRGDMKRNKSQFQQNSKPAVKWKGKAYLQE